MKQKKLLTKPLAMVLAAAMAVTSLTLPGGLLEPQTVYAETQYDKSNIENVTIDAKAGTISATVPSDAADLLQYQLMGPSTSPVWTSKGKTIEKSTVSFKLPVGSYTAVCLSFSNNADSYVKLEKNFQVGYDLSSDVGSTLKAQINDSETTISNGDVLAYTGQPVVTSAKLVTSPAGVAIDSDAYSVFFYKNSVDTLNMMVGKYPTDEGTYVISFSTNDKDGYPVGCTFNKAKITFTIAKQPLTSDEVKEHVSYTAPEALTYTGTDLSDTVKKAVTVSGSAADWNIDNVWFETKDSAGKAVSAAALTDAGTYDVCVKLSSNISSGIASVGAVTIGKYQPTLSDITVTAAAVTYDGEKHGAGIVSHSAMVSDSGIKLSYKKVSDGAVAADADNVSPVDAGTYRVYAAYTEDSNCKAMTATDTGIDLVINKKEISPVINASVERKESNNKYPVDLSEVLKDCGTPDVSKAKITTNGALIESAGYTYDATASHHEIYYSLTEAGQDVTAPTNTTISVDLSDVFTNYSVKFDIPVTIVPAQTTILHINWTGEHETLTYDGKAKEITYNFGSNRDYAPLPSELKDEKGDTKSVSAGAIKGMTETITKDGKTVSEIKDAGTYIVTAVYSNTESGNTYYGKLVQEVTVEGKTVEAEDVKNLFTIQKTEDETTSPAALTYDGKTDYTDTIKGYVKVSGSAIGADDYDVKLENHNVVNGASQAGTVKIMVKLTGGNYTTNDYVEIGTVEIAKASANDLTITDDGKGNLTVKIGGQEISAEKLTIQYYSKSGSKSTALTSKPTKSGSYYAMVCVKDDNFDSTTSKSYSYTIKGSSDSGYSGTTDGSGSTADTTGSTTKTESGTTVTSTEEKHDDGSATVKEELKNEETGVEATVTVEKDASGNVTEAAAEVTEKSSDNKTTISASTVKDIKEAAGTDDVKITTKTVDANGNTLREVSVKASDLTAGKKLKVVAVDKKTGEKTLVNATTYKVAEDGSLSLNNLGNASYEVVDTATAKALTNDVLKTVKVVKEKATVTAGKKTAIKLSKKLNMDNVKKITYTSAKKSVATVSKSGKITAKTTGNATIKAKVVLNNGKTKTVSMKVKVKAKVKIKK